MCLVLGMRGMRALTSCACSCSMQAFCMLVACALHAFGCSCSGVCLRLCACFVIVWCMLGFCMLPACSVHVFDMPTGVCVRLWVCLVLGWCMSLASACFLLVGVFRACGWLFLLVLRWLGHALDVCRRALVACFWWGEILRLVSQHGSASCLPGA